MDDYANWFFRKRPLYNMARPLWMQQNQQRLDEQDRIHPGFYVSIRLVALEALDADDPTFVRKALSVLAVIGEDRDIEHIERLQTHESAEVRKDISTAIFEIKRRHV